MARTKEEFHISVPGKEGAVPAYERGKHYCMCCGTLTADPLVRAKYLPRKLTGISSVCLGCLKAAQAQLESAKRKKK